MSLLTRKGDLWVFDKPAGMLTHPARHDARDPLPDLMTWAREECGAPGDERRVARVSRPEVAG